MTSNRKYFKAVGLIFICCGTIMNSWGQYSALGVSVGATSIQKYLPLVKGKSVGLLVNHTSMVDGIHLLDTLLALNINVKQIFAPEHGFRGNQANGEKVVDGIDVKTGISIVSLYGRNKKPSVSQLDGIEVVIFDIQDIGTRFYTYISSMHYMMEACAENNIQFIVLDRPNPNADYIDGPVLDLAHQSFVGMHPIPVVYAMTAGELALMIKGEHWINDAEQLKLSVIKIKNWNHSTPYALSVVPSPNLPNSQSVALYPSLCLFEGTKISVGRGTPHPFQILGYPDKHFGDFEFLPKSIEGISKYPKHENKNCFGLDLRFAKRPKSLDLTYLINFYQKSASKSDFFNPFFTKLAGNTELQKQIENGTTASEIRKSWQVDLTAFKSKRMKYLIYNDF